jgi:hypothetical protein
MSGEQWPEEGGYLPYMAFQPFLRSAVLTCVVQYPKHLTTCEACKMGYLSVPKASDHSQAHTNDSLEIQLPRLR